MRGIGIGIILTTLILTMSDTKEKLSDKEIMKRATELGMVMAEDGDDELERVLKDLKPSVTEAIDQENVPDTSQEGEPSVGPTQKPSPEPTQEPTQKPTEPPSQTPESEPTPTLSPEEMNAEANNITFTVEKGMSSYQVAKVLINVGLIEDADEFNRYIVHAGKASVIRIGTYTLPQGTTYEEIVKVIAE